MKTETPAIENVSGRNDNTAATDFVDVFGNQLRYVFTWKKWLAWTGKKWCSESGDNRTMKHARQHAKKLWEEAGRAIRLNTIDDATKKSILSYAGQANDARRIENKVKLAQHDDRVSVHHRDIDGDPYLFNCRNGTLDLKSGTFRDHQQEDLLTQLADVNYNPDANCRLWETTLSHVFEGNVDLIRYVQTLMGYSLAGITDEHILPICFGGGNNGKSTIWNTFAAILGDYAALVRQDLLLPNRDMHPTEVADLFGRRFVAVGEPEQGRKLAESQVKEMTGDRILKARRMREDFWQFTPTHTFWLSTNHKPRIEGTDNGIWRRVKLIPFTVDLATVVTVDKAFPEKLVAEYSGILNWAIEGWKRYQREGLIEPEVITNATRDYRDEEDVFGRFLRENYVENDAFHVKATDCYEAFVKAVGPVMTSTEFGTEMGKRFNRERPRIGGKLTTVYKGIGVLE